MDKYGEVYNVGTGKSISIIDLAKKISDNIEYVAPEMVKQGIVVLI